MSAERHAQRTCRGGETERTNKRHGAPRRRQQQSGCDGPEGRRALARDERTIADAAAIETVVRAERVGAPELDHLDRARTVPMILQRDIDEQARAEGEAGDQQDEIPPARRPAGSPCRSPPEVKQAERDKDNERNGLKDLPGRISHWVRGDEMAVSPIEGRRHPEVQLRPYGEEERREERQAERQDDPAAGDEEWQGKSLHARPGLRLVGLPTKARDIQRVSITEGLGG